MPFEPLDLKESSSIAAAAYDRRRRILRVTFKAGRAAHRGGTYDYLDVPADVVGEFLNADSLGRFVNFFTKPSYEVEKDRIDRAHAKTQKAPAFPRGLFRCSLQSEFRIVSRRFSVFGRPGSDLLFQALRLSTIGAGEFNGRVRNGIGFRPPASTTRSAKNGNRARIREQQSR